MIKFWFYVVVLLILAVLGLAVGSANDTFISFDFLFVKKEISVATVFSYWCDLWFHLRCLCKLTSLPKDVVQGKESTAIT